MTWAAEAKIEDEWNRTSELIAKMLEIHRDPEKRRQPFHWKEFHPTHQRVAERVRKTAPRVSVKRLKKWVKEGGIRVHDRTARR